jgi:alpha-glucosidase
MQPLDTHDTARFATHAAEGTIPLAVGLSMTLPGIPVVFAGDEFGLTGVDGEMSRTPIPWNRIDEPEVAERIALYRDLIGIRHAHEALRTGGLRFVYVDETAVAFVRESTAGSVLVLATTADVDVELPAHVLPGASAADSLYGDATLATAGDGSVLLAAEGPAFAAWALPGVSAPPVKAASVELPRAGGVI